MVKRIDLTKNYSISRILKGGWQLAGGHGKIDHQVAILDMFAFVKAGVTTFDFGDIYTGVEELVGEFLKEYKNKHGRANNIQLHTKCAPDLDRLSTISEADIEAGIDRSLKRLGVDNLDLVQFHWWDYDIPRYVEVVNYLAKLQKTGKIRYLGVTNFDVARLKEIVDSGVKIISTQNQYSILDHRPENGLVEFCKENDIKILCYGTAAGGFLSEKYLGKPEPKEPFENRSLTKYRLIIDDFGGWDLFQELLEVVQSIAKKHKVSFTNVASRYILEKPQVAGIIIGARNSKHLEDNLNVFKFKLDKADYEAINEVLSKAKGPKGDCYGLERIKGGKHAVIMKYNLNKE